MHDILGKKTINDLMFVALQQAKLAYENNEVPVGCLIVTSSGEIVGKSRNKMLANKDATAHAEINAIRLACKKLNTHRLDNLYLFTTLEPCAMCAGAIVNARIKKIFIATDDYKTGALLGQLQLYNLPIIHHKPQIKCGIRASESSDLLKLFFKERRK